MAETTVFGCDWCKEIVEKRDGKPNFAAFITSRPVGIGQGKVEEFDVCHKCRAVFKAVTEGKFKR